MCNSLAHIGFSLELAKELRALVWIRKFAVWSLCFEMQPVGNIFFFTRVRCWVVALLLVCTLKFILPKIKQSFSESPVKCTQPKDKKAAMVLLSLCLREMCPTGELKKLRWYHYKPLNVPGKYNTSLRLFLYSEQGFFIFCSLIFSERLSHNLVD